MVYPVVRSIIYKYKFVVSIAKAILVEDANFMHTI